MGFIFFFLERTHIPHIAFKALPDIAKRQRLSALLPRQWLLIMQQKDLHFSPNFYKDCLHHTLLMYSNASEVSAHPKYVLP